MTTDRLAVVCESIYAAFSTGYDEVDSSDRLGLSQEAIWLARTACLHAEGHPEVQGLLSLMLFIDARSAARRSAEGRFVPLDKQNPAQWDAAKVGEADSVLRQASRAGQVGRFQLEAAIQSVHADRIRGQTVDWHALESLYQQLVQLAPTLGVRVAQIAVWAETRGPDRALRLLHGLADYVDLSGYQPFWATRAELERRSRLDYRESAARAAALTEDNAVREYLLRERERDDAER